MAAILNALRNTDLIGTYLGSMGFDDAVITTMACLEWPPSLVAGNLWRLLTVNPTKICYRAEQLEVFITLLIPPLVGTDLRLFVEHQCRW